MAKAAGVVHTPVDGDQPSLLIGLVAWAGLLGLPVVAAGKSSKSDVVYDPATATATSLGPRATPSRAMPTSSASTGRAKQGVSGGQGPAEGDAAQHRARSLRDGHRRQPHGPHAGPARPACADRPRPFELPWLFRPREAGVPPCPHGRGRHVQLPAPGRRAELRRRRLRHRRDAEPRRPAACWPARAFPPQPTAATSCCTTPFTSWVPRP